MTFDRRPIAVLLAPYGGDYTVNRWGLTREFVADPCKCLRDGEALVSTVEQKFGSGLRRLVRDTAGCLEGHKVHPHIWGAASPRFRQYVMDHEPRIDDVYLGWVMPGHRNTTLASTDPQLTARRWRRSASRSGAHRSHRTASSAARRGRGATSRPATSPGRR